MIAFRASEPKDAHYLLDIDIKCFDYAWLPSEWRIVAQHCVACVATWNGTPIGMAIFGKNADGDVQVVKLAVKPAYRHRGIATGLMRNCALYAREIHAPRLVLLVPESWLCPGQPGDISGWLVKLGFRAHKPLLRNQFTFYGQSEDGVLFSLPVPLA